MAAEGSEARARLSSGASSAVAYGGMRRVGWRRVAYRREDYPEPLPEELPWLDRRDAQEAIRRRLEAGEIGEEQARWLAQWERDGYVVFERLLDVETAEAINADVEAIYQENRHLPLEQLRERFKNAYPRSAATRRALCLPELLERIDLVLGRRVIPHQTLNLPVSSQQAAHSDQILMTTHPPGYLVAAWFALQDVDEECGPLVIYPGSHRLPYVGAREVGIPYGASEAECGRVYDERYYGLVADLVAQHGLQPMRFLPRQGDVLLWHSNLLHGADPIEREGATRKSLIAHYFADGVEHYSDLFQWACLSPDLRPRAARAGQRSG